MIVRANREIALPGWWSASLSPLCSLHQSSCWSPNFMTTRLSRLIGAASCCFVYASIMLSCISCITVSDFISLIAFFLSFVLAHFLISSPAPCSAPSVDRCLGKALSARSGPGIGAPPGGLQTPAMSGGEPRDVAAVSLRPTRRCGFAVGLSSSPLSGMPPSAWDSCACSPLTTVTNSAICASWRSRSRDTSCTSSMSVPAPCRVGW
mmetsp:Transcript_33606/g.73461  ORF Transcript_33606/g.73461 Transcript_33606/m.73461 type:complete len:207 (-) Transcript_33606:149-769(-)